MEASAQQLRVADLKEIDLTLVEVSGSNPRKNIKGESFKELKDSIAEHGILEPLVVRPKGDDKYELVAGERRFTAAKELKLEMVPVAIRDFDDAQARVVMLLENLQREDLEPLEEAAALEELLKTGITQEELGSKVSKSQSWVANRLRLMRAPKGLKKFLQEGEVSAQHLVALMPFVDRRELRESVLERVDHAVMDQKNGWSSFTVQKAKDIGEDVVRNLGRALDLSYDNPSLKKTFDYTGCDACKSAVTISSEYEDDDDERYCLKPECFEARLKAAEEKHNQAKAKRESTGKANGKVNLKDLDYGDYTQVESSRIDTSGCKKCPTSVIDKDGERTYRKGARLCLKPSCYRGKISAKSRVRNKAVRATIIRVEEATKEHLQGREAGLTLGELRFIHEWIGDKAEYKARPKATRTLKTAKELEDSILNCLVKDELAPIRHNHSENSIQQLQRHVPFKVKKAPGTPDKKTKKKPKG